LFASFVVLVVARRLRRGKVVFSQQGIHQRGWAFSSFLRWDSFAGVKAAYNGSPEVLVIAYSNVPWDKWQIVVYWLLKFYVDNPAARAELGTEAAILRARSGVFT
jgi:hypothetical protein